MERNEMQKALVQSAIHIVANEGIDKVKVDKVAHAVGLNVAYLYRFFGGKNGLFKESFRQIDAEFRDFVYKHAQLLYANNISQQECWENFIVCLWEFALQDREKCLFFIRYYYSVYFDSYSGKDRQKFYESAIEKLAPAFREGVDVWKQLNYIYDVIFSSIVKVMRDADDTNEEIRSNVCHFIYTALSPKLALEEREDI